MRPRLNALTTLRFLAALHVVFFHVRVVGILPGGPWWYQNFASIGFVGVNFFFVLSGFILVYTYDGPQLDAPKFWRARFARIYPAYALSLIVAAPFFLFAVRNLDLPFFAWSKTHFIPACMLTLALLQSWVPQAALTWNSVCWSLSVEAFFYFVFPFFLLRNSKLSARSLLLWLVAFWLISLSLSSSYIHFHPDGFDKINSGETNLFWKNVLSFNPLVRLPEFLVGMFAGKLFLSRPGSVKFATPLAGAGLLGFATVVLLAPKIPNPTLSAGLLSPAFAAIIYGVARQPKWTLLLATPFLVLLGEASYSLYLLHSLVITRVFDSIPHLSWPLRVALSLAAAIAISVAAYRLLEEPSRRFLRPKK